MSVGPAFDEAKETMTRMTNERERARRRMEGLCEHPTDAKQGRGKQFRTKKERDAHLRSQIQELAVARAEKEELLNEKQSKLRQIVVSEGLEAGVSTLAW